jgi:GTP-binding protein
MAKYFDDEFIIADLPGLIEGAAEGKGLGHEFLKHIQRTNLLLHLIPATEADPEQAYQTVRAELKQFDPALVEKKEIVVLSQIDAVNELTKEHKDFIKKHKALKMSAVSGEGVQDVLKSISENLSR